MKPRLVGDGRLPYLYDTVQKERNDAENALVHVPERNVSPVSIFPLASDTGKGSPLERNDKPILHLSAHKHASYERSCGEKKQKNQRMIPLEESQVAGPRWGGEEKEVEEEEKEKQLEKR